MEEYKRYRTGRRDYGAGAGDYKKKSASPVIMMVIICILFLALFIQETNPALYAEGKEFIVNTVTSNKTLVDLNNRFMAFAEGTPILKSVFSPSKNKTASNSGISSSSGTSSSVSSVSSASDSAVSASGVSVSSAGSAGALTSAVSSADSSGATVSAPAGSPVSGAAANSAGGITAAASYDTPALEEGGSFMLYRAGANAGDAEEKPVSFITNTYPYKAEGICRYPFVIVNSHNYASTLESGKNSAVLYGLVIPAVWTSDFILPANVELTYSPIPVQLKPPVNGTVSSKFGWRSDPFSDTLEFHTGVDIAAQDGTKIHAAAAGDIAEADATAELGNYIVINHSDGISTLYAHCSVLYVKKGDKAKAGEVIAAVGSTGKATGPHLHFEVMSGQIKRNPEQYINVTA